MKEIKFQKQTQKSLKKQLNKNIEEKKNKGKEWLPKANNSQTLLKCNLILHPPPPFPNKFQNTVLLDSSIYVDKTACFNELEAVCTTNQIFIMKFDQNDFGQEST